MSWPRPLILACLSIFAVGAAAGADASLLEWDWVSMEAASAWASGLSHEWLFDHPPLYPFLISLGFRLFSISPETARFFNTALLLGAAFFVYLAGKNISGRTAGITAASFYLVSPVTVQGLRSLDSSDTTLLPLCFAVIFWIFTAARDDGRRWKLGLAVAFAAAFFAKVTSSLALVLVFMVCVAMLRPPAALKVRALALSGLAGGILFFLAVWSAVSLVLWGRDSWAAVLSTPFVYFSSGGGASIPGHFLKSCLDAVRALFWFSPFLIFLAAHGLAGTIRRGDSPASSRLLALVCLAYFAGHIVIGGSNYGFPRYHAAISPLLHVFAGCAAAGIDLKGVRRPAVMAALAAGSMSALIDPQLLMTLELKKLFFHGKYSEELFFVAAPLLLYSVLPFAVSLPAAGLRAVPPGRMLAPAMAAFLAASAVFSVRHSVASYSTSYQYGAEGKRDVVELISRKAAPGDSVMATREFGYALSGRGAGSPGWSVWRSDAAAHEFISKEKPDFVVAGWTTHTASQLEWLLSKGRTRESLDKEYILSTVGTYFVWERRDR